MARNFENSKVISKIKKLLALGSSSNLAEASAAIEKAEFLMNEYGINESDLAFQGAYVQVEEPVLPIWKNQLMGACAYVHNCAVVFIDGAFLIVGRPSAVAISELMYNYLADCVMRKTNSQNGYSAEAGREAIVFFLATKLYALARQVAWLDDSNERMGAEKAFAKLYGNELVIMPDNGKAAREVPRGALEKARVDAESVLLSRQAAGGEYKRLA